MKPRKTPEDRWESWKDDPKLEGINKANSKIIIEYLFDMEAGKRVGGNKGKRSPIRLLTLRSRMSRIASLIQEHKKKDILEISYDELMDLFSDMESGKIRTIKGEKYKSVRDYAKAFKAFWHWYQRRERQNRNFQVNDITADLDTTEKEVEFNDIDIDQLKLIAAHSNNKYKVLMWFLFDSGVRAPSEAFQIKVSDITKDKKGVVWLRVREETSKTFGRTFKLVLSGEIMFQYIKEQKLQKNDLVFDLRENTVNAFLKRIGYNKLNIGDVDENHEGIVEAHQIKNGLTLYDFRHSSAIYWRYRYPSEAAFKRKFGWKKDTMPERYTKRKGMKDSITQDDILEPEGMHDLQKQYDVQAKELELLKEQMESMQNIVSEVMQSKTIIKLRNTRGV